MTTTGPPPGNAAASAPQAPEALVAIADRCSFATRDAFRDVQGELALAQHATERRELWRRPTRFVAPSPSTSGGGGRDVGPPFVAAVRTESRFALKTRAAQRNDHVRTPYQPPSAHDFRVESPPGSWRAPGVDFVAKFHLPSKQDLARRVALDQEGFFAEHDAGGATATATAAAAACDFVPADLPPDRGGGGGDDNDNNIGGHDGPSSTPASSSPSRPAFQARVPHTSRKSSNVELRLEKIVDQAGLLPELREIRAHRYRDEAAAGTVDFYATFKPAPALSPMGGAGMMEQPLHRSPSRQRRP